MKNNNKATNLGRQGQGGASGQSGSSAVEELSRNLSLALMAAANGNNASGLPRQSPTSEEPGQVKAQDGVPDPAQSELAKALELAVARKKAAAITEMSSSSSSVGARPSTATSISPVDEETSSATRKKSANVKKDRSKLRKGKWTVSLLTSD